MAKLDLSIQRSQISTVDGPNPVSSYDFDLVDKDAIKIIDTFQTTDKAAAKQYFDQTIAQYKPATVNDIPGANPFDDGFFDDMSDAPVDGIGTDGAFGKTESDPTRTDPPRSARLTPPSPAPTATSSNLQKVARDLCGLAKEKKKDITRLTEEQMAKRKINGAFCNIKVQAKPHRDMAPCETMVGCGVDNNACIVIGNDRPGKRHEGYAGKGHTHCASIDLVTGLGGWCAKEEEEIKIIDEKTNTTRTITRPMVCNPNFFVDSARIYISQKTDVDKNFGIGKFGRPRGKAKKNRDDKDIGKYGAKSAVVLKADNIRVIGRESIRLVTGTDAFNSQGGEVGDKSGIELVAMNLVDKLQPIVLGNNLQLALNIIVDNIEALAKILHGYLKYQMAYNQALQQHTHITPFFGIPTLVSEKAIISGIQCDLKSVINTELSILKHITNLQGVKHNYLVPSGETFINSRLNKSN